MTHSQLTVAESQVTLDLQDFVSALKGASGITEDQARICVLYALCTFRDDLTTIPILAVVGSTGTGKSSLVNQMTELVKNPTVATATTRATMRDEMAGCGTYLIHEGDKVSEFLLQQRTDTSLSRVTHNVGTGHGWEPRTSDIFGATIVARRNPFRDSAARNRAIVIRTRRNPSEYTVTQTGDLSGIFSQLKIEKVAIGFGRVRDTWAPLVEVANALHDPIWAEAIERFIGTEETVFRAGGQYESESAVIQALDKLTWNADDATRLDDDVTLADVTKEACEIGEVNLTKKMVEEVLVERGFAVTNTHGVKFVRSNPTLLEKLLSDT